MMHKKNVLLGSIIGAGVGYGVVHPLVMFISKSMMAAHGSLSDSLVAATDSAFSLKMLPWNAGFGLVCGIMGFLIVKLWQTRIRHIKSKAITEMAGATCHELNQPMQVVLGCSELLSGKMDNHEDMKKILKTISDQIVKMDRILKQINHITSYETRDYVGGIRIVDIEKASRHRLSEATKKQKSKVLTHLRRFRHAECSPHADCSP